MKHALLKGALPIYARMLADSCGVQVKFGGAVAKTDGITIFLPDLPIDDPDSKALAFGMIMHEEGHITETQFSEVPANRVVLDMANRLEDIRMEKVQMKKYPGARQRLALMVEALIKTGYFGAPSPECSPNEAMSAFVLYRLRTDVLRQSALTQYADLAEEQCRKLLPKAAVTRLNTLMREVENCRNTADVITLSEEIIKMLVEEKEKENPSDTSGAPDSDPSSTPDDGGTPDDKIPNGPQGSEDDPDGGDPLPQPGSPVGSKEDKTDNLARILSGEDDRGMVDVGDLLTAAIGEMAKKGDQKIHFPAARHQPIGFGDGNAMLQRVRDQTRALRRRLANELEAAAQTHRQIARRGRRILANRLYRVATMNPRVFEQTITGDEVNTAVLVLVDKSTSMSRQIHLAVDASLGLFSALSEIHGVETSVAMFPENVDGDSNGIAVLAGFGERIRERAACFSGISATGSTPMAQAMMWAGLQLVSRKEERKILFICTDGDPDDLEAAQSMIKILEDEGIEIMSLGIAKDTSGLFMNNRTIASIDEMPVAVFQMMRNQLLKAA